MSLYLLFQYCRGIVSPLPPSAKYYQFTVSILQEYREHMETIHFEEHETFRICKICNKQLKNKHSHNEHLMTHSPYVKRYLCADCGDSFKVHIFPVLPPAPPPACPTYINRLIWVRDLTKEP